ncbi:MAG: hypothetical protein KGL39_03480 [Patescibacteria group bacterium]|nr:hypothetical protein [Patescibacteria group bacterium]
MTLLNGRLVKDALVELNLSELQIRIEQRRRREIASHNVPRKSARWRWKKRRAAGTDMRKR